LGSVPTPTIRFGVQADITSDAPTWLQLAGKVEALGFDALYVADHPGVSASPFAALAAAASATSTLKLGTYVCNTGSVNPSQSPVTPRPWTSSRTAGSSSGSAPGTRPPNGR
jgi:hypothetical protein